MKGYPVIKGTSCILAATSDMVLYNGIIQTTERVVDPDSDYLVELPRHLRGYEDVLSYIPNQVYIGDATHGEPKDTQPSYYDKKWKGPKEERSLGCTPPESEFYGVTHIRDVFELVMLEHGFAQTVKDKLEKRGMFTQQQLEGLLKNSGTGEELERPVTQEHSEGFYIRRDELVGVVKRAHDVDVNLSAHVMLENLVSKVFNVIPLIKLKRKNNFDPDEVEYVIDCCEEACGDMSQRGGGNFAKASAEIADYKNATGPDVRGLCAGPAHAMIHAAALVKSGTFKHVIVTAGGCTAKLGMNGKDHVKKGLPVLEDCIAGFSVLVSEDDGIHPMIRTDIVGCHKIGTDSVPQMVISSLVAESLEKAGLTFTDIDKYASELQNPDIIKPAGAGDVLETNYKMIAALAAVKKQVQWTDILSFVKEHGMTGRAPTRGHIPSGVPYLGPLVRECMEGETKRAIIVGKGSLLLGHMTNLFGRVSFVVKASEGEGKTGGKAGQDAGPDVHQDAGQDAGPDAGQQIVHVIPEHSPFHPMVTAPCHGARIVFALEGSKQGQEDTDPTLGLTARKGTEVNVCHGTDAHRVMEFALESGSVQAGVTTHYLFPIGVSTVGKVITPARGKVTYIANTTGTSHTDRVSVPVKNAITGIIAVKADGVSDPAAGIVNIDGARSYEKILKVLEESGYDITSAESAGVDKGVEVRGNNLLMGTADVAVMDFLTGNLMMKLFSSYTTGGQHEATGYRYGPGVGEGHDRLVTIVFRAPGAPMIVGAMEYAASLITGDWKAVAVKEYEAARRAGLDELLAKSTPAGQETAEEVTCPLREVVTAAIPGIEVMNLDKAVKTLQKEGIYAEDGMGCTGPIVQISEVNLEKAAEILKKAGYTG